MRKISKENYFELATRGNTMKLLHPFTIVTTVKVKGKAPIEYTRIVYAKTATEALLQKEIKQS
jgi:hypothetical protein